MEYKHFLDQLLDAVVAQTASDLHFSEGRYPSLRVNGDLIPLMDTKILEKGGYKTWPAASFQA